MTATSAQSEVGRLAQVVVKHARDAFRDDATIEAQWRALNFIAPPDRVRAIDEYDRFLDLLKQTGAEVRTLPCNERVTLDSIYVRDASSICDRGVIICNMGKPERADEPAVQKAALERMGLPIAGEIRDPGRLEGGDVVWIDSRTVAVGRGYRTNDEGIRQFRALLGDLIDELIVVSLPHWRGSADVFHLMSILSPIDQNLAVAYSPLMPAAFRERLLARGVELVEVPEQEFQTMGTNVLALAPRVCLMLAGNPVTRAALERAGATVLEYEGREISLKGGGGPTCLTRPLARIME